MLILSMCENPSILKVIYYIKLLIKGIQYLVPIILIVTISLDAAKGVTSGEEVSKILGKVKVRAIAAVSIFFVPLFVDIILGLTVNVSNFSLCWDNAKLSLIEKFQIEYDEREMQRQEEENTINSEYTDANSHKNSINGIRYKLYNQADSRWGSVKYSNGKTIADIGCLITSMAVVSSSADHNITPLYVFEKKANNYYITNAIPKLTGEGMFKCSVGSITHDGIVNQLKKGNVAIIMVKEASSFTSSQHYMALIDVSADGKQIFVGNSYGSGTGSGRNGWFNSKTVLTDVHEYVYCVPSQTLIDKFN